MPKACVTQRNKDASVWPARGLCDSSVVPVMTRAHLGPSPGNYRGARMPHLHVLEASPWGLLMQPQAQPYHLSLGAQGPHPVCSVGLAP